MAKTICLIYQELLKKNSELRIINEFLQNNTLASYTQGRGMEKE